MKFLSRLTPAIRAAALHFLGCVVVALLAAGLVFNVWYPFPYSEISGGRELFLLVVSVDVVCGPVLTFVLFNPQKPRAELMRDLAIVFCLQTGALIYGLVNVWEARPLYLVHEVDRFKVVAAPDLDPKALDGLPQDLRTRFFGSPILVSIRSPKSVEEKNQVMFAAAAGGKDYAQLPEFYVSYSEDSAKKVIGRSAALNVFLSKYSDQVPAAQKLALQSNHDVANLRYVPVTGGRQDWVAVIDGAGEIIGFLKGDGF